MKTAESLETDCLKDQLDAILIISLRAPHKATKGAALQQLSSPARECSWEALMSAWYKIGRLHAEPTAHCLVLMDTDGAADVALQGNCMGVWCCWE